MLRTKTFISSAARETNVAYTAVFDRSRIRFSSRGPKLGVWKNISWFTQRLRLVFTRRAPLIGHKIISYQSEPDISGGGEGVGLFANPARHLTLLVVHAFLFIFIHFNMSLSCPQNTLANCLLIQWKFVLEEAVLGTQAVTPALFVQYSCWHLRECSVGCTPGTYLLYHLLHF